MRAKERAGSHTITFLFCARLCFCVSKKVTMPMMTSSATSSLAAFMLFHGFMRVRENEIKRNYK
jgi:hypothetical protein